ncbi:hypothetical protein [Kangiella sp.]|uniref:hypothetical protein n=1 Tax=Kangiella sp. TaxID=1920245 RepID=UPI003A93526B
MMEIYDLFYKDEFTDNVIKTSKFDKFISAYNQSERVQGMFQKITADHKIWLIFPEYRYQPEELSDIGKYYICEGNTSGEQIISFLNNSGLTPSDNILIDITGFMRPQLATFLKYLHRNKFTKFELVYSEPMNYTDQEKTTFSYGNLSKVMPVTGFEGPTNSTDTDDVLIVGTSYDHTLIKKVCIAKEHAKYKFQLVGFPPLRPDMYQENIYRASKAINEIGEKAFKNKVFAPADDPFITAKKLSETVKRIEHENGYTNLYLCSLGTKPQTVGFVLYYLIELEQENKPARLIYPFFEKYSRETTQGNYRSWKYTIEF